MARILAINRENKIIYHKLWTNKILQVILFYTQVFIDDTSPLCHYPGHTNYNVLFIASF